MKTLQKANFCLLQPLPCYQGPLSPETHWKLIRHSSVSRCPWGGNFHETDFVLRITRVRPSSVCGRMLLLRRPVIDVVAQVQTRGGNIYNIFPYWPIKGSVSWRGRTASLTGMAAECFTCTAFYCIKDHLGEATPYTWLGSRNDAQSLTTFRTDLP